LQAAESAFVNTALKDSELHPFARLVANLPQQNLPTFRAALKVLLDSWNEDNLQSTLEANLERDAPGFESAAHRRTAALYLTHLHAHLVRLPVYREVINSLAVLRVEDNTQRIEALLERLLDFERLKALEIPRWPVRPHPQGLGLSHVLLRAEYRLVPFVGAGPRETLDELLEWARGLQADNACSLRFYTGPGGAGKTRLLIEAGEALLDDGWRVGFLPEGGVNADNARYLVEDGVPTLLVLDYVATRSQEVETILQAMAGDRAGRQAPVALVLLERAHLAELEQKL